MRDFSMLDESTRDALSALFRFADNAEQMAHDSDDYKTASMVCGLIGRLDAITDECIYIATTQGATA